MNPDEVDGEIVRTSGLSSVVDSDDGCIGHILMIDYDDTEDVLPVLADLDAAPGVSVLVESSPGSYHGYNLSVRPLETQVYHAARSVGDMRHVRRSARRGYFVLRAVPKVREETREVYKEAPEPVRVLASDLDHHAQSGPHMRFLANAAREDGNDEVADELEDLLDDDSVEAVGSGLRVDHYQSGTDDLKQATADAIEARREGRS